MYVLWRDREFLGRIVGTDPVRGNDDKIVGFAGTLDVGDSTPKLSSVMQQKMFMLPGRPIQQQHFGPIEIGSESNEAYSEAGDEACKPMTEVTDEEMRGVPDNQVLRIEDENGAPVPTNWLTIWHHRVPSDVQVSPEELASSPGKGKREWWYVSVMHASEWPDTETLAAFAAFDSAT